MQHPIVSIVAGGPSALKCGASVAPGYVIAVNDSYQHVRHDAVLSMDGRWAMHRAPEWFDRDDAKPLHLRDKAWRKVQLPERTGIPALSIFNNDNKTGRFGQTQHTLNGPNSGYCALNLAFTMRPFTVYLYGFDHRGDHFYPESEWRKRGEGSVNGAGKFVEWASYCFAAQTQFQRHGIDVVNTYNDSRITAFRFGSPAA